MSELQQFLQMTGFERIKLFATLFLLLLFSFLFGYPAILKLLDDETHSVKIEGLRQKKLYNGFYGKYLLLHVWRDDFR